MAIVAIKNRIRSDYGRRLHCKRSVSESWPKAQVISKRQTSKCRESMVKFLFKVKINTNNYPFVQCKFYINYFSVPQKKCAPRYKKIQNVPQKYEKTKTHRETSTKASCTAVISILYRAKINTLS